MDLILEAEEEGPEQNGYKNWNRACTTVTTVFSEFVGHNGSAEFFVVQCVPQAAGKNVWRKSSWTI